METVEKNKLIAEFMGWNPDAKAGYANSGVKDIYGTQILEGSIINADGYNSDLESEQKRFHCVEFDDGIFGSDIYSDFEPISTYKTIVVLGHCTDYAHLIDTELWSGNLGAVLKGDVKAWQYHDSWNRLMPVIEKIQTLGYGYKISYGNCYIYGDGVCNSPSWNVTADTTIEAVYDCVLQFITYYNSNEGGVV